MRKFLLTIRWLCHQKDTLWPRPIWRIAHPLGSPDCCIPVRGSHPALSMAGPPSTSHFSRPWMSPASPPSATLRRPHGRPPLMWLISADTALELRPVLGPVRSRDWIASLWIDYLIHQYLLTCVHAVLGSQTSMPHHSLYTWIPADLNSAHPE